MARSITYSRGKGKLTHNTRELLAANVDSTRTANNVVLVNQSLSAAYKEVFGKAQQAYNDKQKRKDRKIDDYFTKLFEVSAEDKTATEILTNDNKQQSFYEWVVGIGGGYDTAVVDWKTDKGKEIKGNPEAAKLATECLREYIEGNEDAGVPSYAKRNPNFHIFQAIIHLDEHTPHLHIDAVPFSDGYKRGMTRQQGIAKALEAMGYGEGEQAIAKWQDSERAVMREIAERHGFEIREEQKSRGYTIATKQYAEYAENELALAEQKADIEEYNEQIEDLQGQMGRLSQTVEDLTEQAGDLILQRDRLTDKVDKMQDTIEDLKEQEQQAHNALLKATKAPPRPKEPSKPTEYDMWTLYHPLKDYASGKMFDNEKKQEERRKADYQAKEVEPYEKAVQACREWDSEWGLVETAKKVLQEKEELTEKQNALRRKETALREREQKIEQNIEVGVEKRIQSIFHGSVATGEAYRLREYCADVKFKDGTSVLDRFEQSERELEAEVRERNQVLKSSQGMSR